MKLGKRRIAIVAVALAAVVVALMIGNGNRTGSSGTLDDAANRACAEFAAGAGKARSAGSRLALADRVSRWSTKTDNDTIADRAAALGRSANDGDAAWRKQATAFTAACHDAGWPPAKSAGRPLMTGAGLPRTTSAGLPRTTGAGWPRTTDAGTGTGTGTGTS